MFLSRGIVHTHDTKLGYFFMSSFAQEVIWRDQTREIGLSVKAARFTTRLQGISWVF